MGSNLINSSLLENIRELLSESRNKVYQAVNHAMIHTYWSIGRLIVEDEQKGAERSEYGSHQLEKLSAALCGEFGKGFDITNIRRMRKIYLTYPNRDTLSPELSWSHYRALLRLTNKAARDWYEAETISNSWSVRALERQINKLYYERLLASRDKEAVVEEAQEKTKKLSLDPKHYLRDPYLLEFLNIPNTGVLETDIEEALLTNLQEFLLELGKGFAFVERQQRIKTDGQDFAIDLVFYNYILKCFVLIDIKLNELTHQDVGQMDTYVRIYDDQKKGELDNPTVGLILCSKKSKAIAKYSILADSKQVFASKYFSYLPTEEELAIEIQREAKLLGFGLGDKE